MTEQDHDTPDADGRLDTLLRAANPVSDEQVASWTLGPELDEVFCAVVSRVDGGSAGGRQRRSGRVRRALTAGAVAGTVLAAGGVAAAAWTSAHTGVHGHAGMSENDTSEWLNTAGDDFPSVARQLGQRFPFPPGDDVDAYIPGQLREGLTPAHIATVTGRSPESIRVGLHRARQRLRAALVAADALPLEPAVLTPNSRC